MKQTCNKWYVYISVVKRQVESGVGWWSSFRFKFIILLWYSCSYFPLSPLSFNNVCHWIFVNFSFHDQTQLEYINDDDECCANDENTNWLQTCLITRSSLNMTFKSRIFFLPTVLSLSITGAPKLLLMEMKMVMRNCENVLHINLLHGKRERKFCWNLESLPRVLL